MKIFKGTQGDWIVQSDSNCIWIENEVWTIADISKKDTKEEQKSNAKLIAAAPELLKALQSVKKAFENKIIDSTNGKDASAGALIFIIDRAIDKALD